MSKAILVMDMPECCNQCELCWCQDGEYFCIPDDFKHYLDIKATERPDWCPLKEMPQKKICKYHIDEKYMRGVKDGYNTCIEEIMRGSEENE